LAGVTFGMTTFNRILLGCKINLADAGGIR